MRATLSLLTCSYGRPAECYSGGKEISSPSHKTCSENKKAAGKIPRRLLGQQPAGGHRPLRAGSSPAGCCQWVEQLIS